MLSEQIIGDGTVVDAGCGVGCAVLVGAIVLVGITDGDGRGVLVGAGVVLKPSTFTSTILTLLVIII
jgi:hypothetical protein